MGGRETNQHLAIPIALASQRNKSKLQHEEGRSRILLTRTAQERGRDNSYDLLLFFLC